VLAAGICVCTYASCTYFIPDVIIITHVNPFSKTSVLHLLLHVHWAHGPSVQDYFCEYLHTYGSRIHSEIKLGYLSNDSDWLWVGQTRFLFSGSSRNCYIVNHLVKTGSGTDPASCPIVPELIVPGVKSSFSAKVKNLWSFISILSDAYLAWCLDTGTMFTAVLTAKFWFYD
jgi:hypothetical protein